MPYSQDLKLAVQKSFDGFQISYLICTLFSENIDFRENFQMNLRNIQNI